MSTLVHKDNFSLTDTGIPVLRRDKLLDNDNEGVRFLWDLSSGFSYQAGTPSDGKAVGDIAGVSSPGVIANPAGTLSFAGNGLDFSSAEAKNRGIKVPPSVAADLFADQEYLICAYLKMPEAANWHNGGVAGISGALFSAVEGSSANYLNTQDIVTIGFSTQVAGNMEARRQTSVGAMSSRPLTGALIHAGLIAQVSFWRNANNVGFRIKSSAGESISTGTPGGKNTADFSGKTINFGNFSSFGTGTTPPNWYQGVRYYRGFVENLKRSGRDPISVLDDDYARIIERGAFS